MVFEGIPQLQHCWLDNSLSGEEVVQCILIYSATSLASTYQMLKAPPSFNNQKCLQLNILLMEKSTPTDNQ